MHDGGVLGWALEVVLSRLKSSSKCDVSIKRILRRMKVGMSILGRAWVNTWRLIFGPGRMNYHSTCAYLMIRGKNGAAQ